METSRFLLSALATAGAVALFGCSAEVNPDAIVLGADGSTTAVTPSVEAGVSDANSVNASLPDVPPVGPPQTGLHVAGNQILNAQGQPVVLHGVNRSGTEYRCAQGAGIFDGPSDEASIQQIALWKASAVRVPLNESCWLGINGSPAPFSGDAYKNAIKGYVALLHKYNIAPILELHWVGPGNALALAQQPLPDFDHAPTFWADVTATFLGDDGVIFEPYNEPFPDSNMESTAAWTCWKGGCDMVNEAFVSRDASPATYKAAGMQDLVDSIRQTEQAKSGVTHVIILGGVEYSNDLTQWLAYEPTDTANPPQLGAAWHVYNYNGCNSAACWNMAPAAVAAVVPLVTTEIGENDCAGGSILPLMQWLDGKTASYLAWSWNAFGTCRGASYNPDSGVYSQGNPYSLISDYTTGTPDTNSTYAKTYHDHIASF